MSKSIFFLFQISICNLFYLYYTNNLTLAQVTSDGTVNTQVNQNGNVAEITGGQTRGSNLFHSFQNFSVSNGNEAFFNNANDISNILSRVTGGNISNIDGLIRANGSASLFLINPVGIIFGENARLDIGGSFLGSTASSVLFEDGELSATDFDSPPLLTVNAPIGLRFRDNPGDIIISSVVPNSAEGGIGLEVLPGNNLAFIGGNINFEGGKASARGGNIELGGLSQTGIVGINGDGSLSFPDQVTKADINLTNGARVDAEGTGGGSVTVNARNLNLSAGELGSSLIRTGIGPESTFANAQAGDITINVNNLTLDDSRIINQVNGVGNSGNIEINTGSLTATKGGNVDSSTFGQGNAGAVNIIATGDISLDGENSLFSGGILFSSGIFSGVNPNAIGDAGGVNISTTNLNLTRGGRIGASTFGQGNAGAINIIAKDNITADGENSLGFPSGVSSGVNPNAIGDAGGVNISTTNLNLTRGGRVGASTAGQGNAGNLTINATESIEINGLTPDIRGGIFANAVNPPEGILRGTGNGGNINIFTNLLAISDEGAIEASNLDSLGVFEPGSGAPGNIIITANSLKLSDEARIETANLSEAGEGANITLNVSDEITLSNNSLISAQAFNDANGGNLNIDARFIITFPDGSNDIIANAERGNGGNITINAESLFGIQEGPLNDSTNDINASSEFSLDGGITINIPDMNPIQGATELPANLVEPEQTITQTCQANREIVANNGLTIKGKGGILPSPDLPLDSQNAYINGEFNSASAIPKPIETGQGKIQPARGIRVTESGEIILTTYRTNNLGDKPNGIAESEGLASQTQRLPESSVNCSRT